MKTYKIEEETKFVNGVEKGKLYSILYWYKPWFRKGRWVYVQELNIDGYSVVLECYTLREIKEKLARLTAVVTYETKVVK